MDFVGLPQYHMTQPKPAPKGTPGKASMRIRGDAAPAFRRGNHEHEFDLARHISDRSRVFAPAVPMRGVIPPNTIAMDSAEQPAPQITVIPDFPMWEGLGFMGYSYLAELSQRPEYSNPVDMISKHMFREWMEFTATGEDKKDQKLKAIEAEFDRLKVRENLCKTSKLDGLFGRAQIFFDFGTSDDLDELKTPIVLSPAKIGIGSLKNIVVIEPVWTYPGLYNTIKPWLPDFYRPSTWFVLGTEVHHTRLATIVSREVPDILKPAYAFGGLSASQLAKPYVDNWLRTRQSVSDLIYSFTTFVFGTDMSSVLNNEGPEGVLARADIFNNARSNMGLFLLDKERETFENVSAPISGLDKLQSQAQEHMASAYIIPLAVLFGITPSGLNASSEGEMKTFNDRLSSCQQAVYSPVIKYILDIVQLSLFGEIDPEIGFRWNPLWTLDELQTANARQIEAQTDIAYIESGVIDPSEARTRVATQDKSAYSGLDLSVNIATPLSLEENDGDHRHEYLEDDRT